MKDGKQRIIKIQFPTAHLQVFCSHVSLAAKTLQASSGAPRSWTAPWHEKGAAEFMNHEMVQSFQVFIRLGRLLLNWQNIFRYGSLSTRKVPKLRKDYIDGVSV
ncbi:uncharacterized protein LOC107304295 isoform X2 [Oryza brachyantha]|uniref:uncharacterized protein LOC107304295 isoform X2 n=1 Tax=Oryza brachyantha TaxID=4533 RepID=UPI00077680A3|nr:uncharacterized protein LOC107304295 isoform X2 [Oryza brachyantha]